MRLFVFGVSGAGKTTFAGRYAKATGTPHVELDLINWRPGWFNRTAEEPEAFIGDVAAATQGDRWVVSGGYSKSWPTFLPRATDLVWLDLPKWRVMAQVIGRSIMRSTDGQDVFPGCRESFLRWLDPGHPIQWAWKHHAGRRRTGERLVADPANAHLRVHRCRSRKATNEALQRLIAEGRR